jgi:serine/threonine-protein kinase RsbW
VDQVGRSQDLDERTLHTLHLVLDEACTNVIEHAYRGQGGAMEIALEVEDDCIRVVIRDWGLPFDPDAVPVPDVTAPLEDRPLGGLGVYLLREMMDEVRYEFSAQDGNTLTLVKSF